MKLTAVSMIAMMSTVADAAPQSAVAPATSAKAVTAAPAATTTTTTTSTTTTAPKFTADTPIEELVADPRANAVLDANLPGMTKHPMYPQFKAMSLKQMAPMSGGRISDEKVAKVNTELAAIK